MDPTDRLTTLAEIEASVWQELRRATVDRHHEWRTPVLATVDDGLPDARTVVLREADAEGRTVEVYTDARARKLAQLIAQPQATLVCWSKRLGWQLRLRVQVTPHTEGMAVTSRWARVKLSPSAGDYLSAQAPGAPLQDRGSLPPAGDRAHFAVLEAQVLAIDWLELHRAGHRRARFDADGARWLQP